MHKEFAPYEIAARLQALGYKEKCFGIYHPTQELFYDLNVQINFDLASDGRIILAPLWQQVIEWIADKYGILLQPLFYKDESGLTYGYKAHEVTETGIRPGAEICREVDPHECKRKIILLILNTL